MFHTFRCRILFSFFMLLTMGVHGQTAITSDSARMALLAWHDQQVGLPNAGLLNGQEYYTPYRTPDTHPFFESETSSKGTVNFAGEAYPDVPLQYDVYADLLLLRHVWPDGRLTMIVLDKPRVETFQLRGKSFQRIENQYYEVVVAGSRYQYLIRHVKETKVVDRRVVYEYRKEHLLNDRGQLSFITGASSLTSHAAQPERMKEFIKSSHIKVGKKNEGDIARVVSAMEQQTKP